MASWTSKLGTRYPRELIDKLDGEHHRTLQKLRKQPANASCAECGEIDTCWASVNLGIFLCVRCSDVHRALGTHLSKVKGCSGTYLWGPDEIEQMNKIGNATAVKLYGGATAQSEPSATKERRLELCRKKYEQGSASAAAPVSNAPVPVAAPMASQRHESKQQLCKPKAEPADLIDFSDDTFWQDFGLSQKVTSAPKQVEGASIGFDDLLGLQVPQSCRAEAAAADAALAPPAPGALNRGDSASFWADLPFASW